MTDLEGNSRRLRGAQEKIRRKLFVLKGYLSNGVPRDAFVPKSMNEFRAWENKKLGLERIGSPNTVSPQSPHNKGLINEVTITIDLLNKPVEQLTAVSQELQDLESLNAALIADWHVAQNEIVVLNEKVGSLLLERKRLIDRVAELTGLMSQAQQPKLKLVGDTPIVCFNGGPREDFP
jgi:hypothetical protein